MSELQAFLFGKFMVVKDRHDVLALNARKVQQLLAYLLVYRKHPLPREQVAELLWDNYPSDKTRKYLRQVLWKLRTALAQSQNEEPYLIVETSWLQFNRASDHWLDIEVFESAFQRINVKKPAELTPGDYSELQNAVGLYTGDLLEGWYEDWCLQERERLLVMLLMMLEKLTRYCEIHGDYKSGLEYCSEILRHDPAYERAHRQIMRLYCLSGDRTRAIRQYRRCESALRDDLGVEPSSRTKSLYHQICDDRFSPNRRQNPHSVNASDREGLADTLLRLEKFSDSLSRIQVQVQKEMQEIEEVLHLHG